MVQGRAQLKHNGHIVMVGVEATCLHFNPWGILKETTELVGPFAAMPQEPWYPGKGAKQIVLSKSTAGSVQVTKQPERGRTSTTVEQKLFSSQRNFD